MIAELVLPWKADPRHWLMLVHIWSNALHCLKEFSHTWFLKIISLIIFPLETIKWPKPSSLWRFPKDFFRAWQYSGSVSIIPLTCTLLFFFLTCWTFFLLETTLTRSYFTKGRNSSWRMDWWPVRSGQFQFASNLNLFKVCITLPCCKSELLIG